MYSGGVTDYRNLFSLQDEADTRIILKAQLADRKIKDKNQKLECLLPDIEDLIGWLVWCLMPLSTILQL